MGNPTGRLGTEMLLLGLLALLWGSSYLFIRIAVAEVPPLTLIAARVTIAGLFLSTVMAWRGERLPRGAGVWGRLLLQAFLNSIGAWTVLAWGEQQVESGLASVLNSTSPVFVFLFGCLGAGARGGWWRLLGAGLGLVGVVLIVGPDVLAGLGRAVAGQLAVLAGAVLYAGAAIHGRRFAGLPATAAATGTMLWAAAFLVPASLALERPWSLAPSVTALAALGLLAVPCTGVALLIYFRLIRTLGSLGVASQSYLRAGVGVLLGTWLLGETVPPVVGLGLAAAVAGVALINVPLAGARGRA
ncbi:EamA-like transporter family protein [Tistlia consotensis]|uniref:EamA-like transporter family protein n=1 Tax=Tistlia consotensis USBA 355 TaxID=560819 RepID=A0A1Y6CKW1_9PROT|nr:EamA family transporter [Tistlia consotensis]SMF72826.1 EamA-like transporter family protein [Tistlia consotensis USBA 355]SNS09798.1 EamA-like transporter family protein [Tistlia consotensis]